MHSGRTRGERGGRGAVVLVVEDNGPMRALLRSVLERITTVVHECESGERALDLYPDLRPDWVLMDIGLAGIDGIATTRALRRLDPDARVVMVTEHGDERYRRAAGAAGACGFLLKENLLELPAMLASSPGPPPGEVTS